MKNCTKKRRFSLFILIVLVLTLNGKNFKTDYQKIQRMPTDSNKVSALIRFTHEYYSTDDSVAAGYSMLLQAYKIAKDINSHKHIADAAYELGDFFNYVKDHVKATDYFIVSLKNAEKINYKLGSARAHMGLGINFYVQKKWVEARTKFSESIAIFESIQALKEISAPLYLNGLVLIELKQFDEAEKLLQKVLQQAEKKEHKSRILECKIALARVNAGLKNYEVAKKALFEILPIYQSSGEKVGVILIQYYLGSIYFETNDLQKALEETQKAMKLADNTNLISNSIEITLLLSRIYEKLGNSEKALFFLNRNQALRDTLFQRDVSSQILISNASYEFEKKESILKEQIEQNKKHKQNLFFIAVLFMLVAIGAIIGFFFIKKERKKSEQLLLNILPAKIAKEIKEKGKVFPKYHKSVTVMFCDVVNFTTICEELDANTIVSILDIYFSAFDKICKDLNLEKIKTIGDCYMLAGGLTTVDQNHAEDCIQAAIRFIQKGKSLEPEMIQKYNKSFQFRIGIHSGSVVSGIVGVNKYVYDIWGDTVNIAARMEQNSKPNEINISGVTFEIINNEIKTQYRGKIKSKNKKEMDMYFVHQN